MSLKKSYASTENVHRWKKSLIKQLGCALPQLYLRGFRNEYTNTITRDIPIILEHLFTSYGDIEPEELKEKEDILRDFFQNHRSVNYHVQRGRRVVTPSNCLRKSILNCSKNYHWNSVNQEFE